MLVWILPSISRYITESLDLMWQQEKLFSLTDWTNFPNSGLSTWFNIIIPLHFSEKHEIKKLQWVALLGVSISHIDKMFFKMINIKQFFFVFFFLKELKLTSHSWPKYFKIRNKVKYSGFYLGVKYFFLISSNVSSIKNIFFYVINLFCIPEPWIVAHTLLVMTYFLSFNLLRVKIQFQFQLPKSLLLSFACTADASLKYYQFLWEKGTRP